MRAYDCLDLIIEIIRGSRSIKEVKKCLISGETSKIQFKKQTSQKAAAKLNFTEAQATAILELRLQKLVGLEIQALEKEYKEILKNIAQYTDILENHSSMLRVIQKDLEAIRKEFSLERRTEILNAQAAVYEEAPIAEQEIVFTMDRFGYAKTMDLSTYERNTETIEHENKYVFRCMNTDRICIFTDTGNMHQIKMLDIPFGKLRDKGRPIDNLGNYSSAGEAIVGIFTFSYIRERKLFFVTTKGMVKLVDASEFDVNRKTVMATKLEEFDKVVCVCPVLENETEVLLSSHGGYMLRFSLEEVPEKKKSAIGVRGMKLAEKDYIEQAFLLENEQEMFTYRNNKVAVSRVKEMKRDEKGTKLRL